MKSPIPSDKVVLAMLLTATIIITGILAILLIAQPYLIRDIARVLGK